MPITAGARVTRSYEGSFGSFSQGTVRALTVDQSNGDIYAISSGAGGKVWRFDTNGAPKDFTAGPDAGTNTLTGFNFGERGDVAIDNSGGPLDGTIYVADSGGAQIKAFARSGAGLGAINGSGAKDGTFIGGTRPPCGVAIDQSNGSLYISVSISGDRVWRYTPGSVVGALSDADYTVAGIRTSSPCAVAADSGHVYVANGSGELRRFSATAFAADPPLADSAVIDGPLDGLNNGVTSVEVDRETGQVYANEGNRVVVFDSAGTRLYAFGLGAHFGASSEGIAIRSATSGPAVEAYVADRHLGGDEIDIFGALTQVPTFTHPTIGTIDDFPSDSLLRRMAFEQAARGLYVLDAQSPGIFGFDASAPPAYPPLDGFSPLTTSPTGSFEPDIAVDNSALASSGNVYLVSESTDLLYGFAPTGAPLAGFPIDPSASPGAPDGFPVELCGVAVDSDANIWVANAATDRILGYSAAGAPLPGSVDTSAHGRPCDLAFDSDDDLYVELGEEGVWKYTTASGYTAATNVDAVGSDSFGLGKPRIAVDPSTDRLYVVHRASTNPGGSGKVINWVDEYDPSGALIDEFATGIPGADFRGVTVDASNGHVYVADQARRIFVFGPGVLLPELRTIPVSGLSNTSATLNGIVISQGLPLSSCHFEYVSEVDFRVSGFADLSSGGSAPCDPAAGEIPLDLDEHAVSAESSGLEPNTRYRFRLLAANSNGTTEASSQAFTTTGPPIVETTGSPFRTATTAQLSGRVYPHGVATSYHFEYGAQGPCDANPCTATTSRSAGSADSVQLVAEEIAGLSPGVTYHYRLVAENGNPDDPALGENITVTTRAGALSPSHGDFSGPPGSDRAWEQVSLPDTSGNPVSAAIGVSNDGNRVLYGVAGGTPASAIGTAYNQFFAERGANGWKTANIFPPREQAKANSWFDPAASDDLSEIVSQNFGTGGAVERFSIWRMSPSEPAEKLIEVPDSARGNFIAVSESASRVLPLLKGAFDPAYPASPDETYFYDVSDGAFHLVSLLPGDEIPSCGVDHPLSFPDFFHQRRELHWVSADGAFAFFPSKGDICGGPTQIYVRDIEAETTTRVSAPSVSGPECSAFFIKATPGAAFFFTQGRLHPEDTEPGSCGEFAAATQDGDVYRYDMDNGSLNCVTCVLPGFPIDVSKAGSSGGEVANMVGVAEDGSRVYFASPHSLIAGALANSTYRVNVGTGEFMHIGRLGILPGDSTSKFTPDGAVMAFRSSDPSLNPLGGLTNGGTAQYYLYDDRNRSLVCASCAQDGKPPNGQVEPLALGKLGRNLTPLSQDGRIFAFTTPTPLVSADQNTVDGGDPRSGADIYEWRDGQHLLVSDGITDWPVGDDVPTPKVDAVTPSGNDIFFTAATRLTPDALEGYFRLYTARIGGGIEFPTPPQPCALETCQGIPTGAPEDPVPASTGFSGPGNLEEPFGRKPSKCPKGKRKVRRAGKVRCVKPRKRAGKRASSRNRANHERKAER